MKKLVFVRLAGWTFATAFVLAAFAMFWLVVVIHRQIPYPFVSP